MRVVRVAHIVEQLVQLVLWLERRFDWMLDRDGEDEPLRGLERTGALELLMVEPDECGRTSAGDWGGV
jgi:hypothetical protein